MSDELRLAATGAFRVLLLMALLMALTYATGWFFRTFAHHFPEPTVSDPVPPPGPAPEPDAEILHESECRAAAAVAIAAVLAHRVTPKAG
jgi:Na+-transporting methylmalonyl-CoA/oxaloacetate decarboxylase gamma subunit